MYYRVRDGQGRVRMFTDDRQEALDKLDFVIFFTGHGTLEVIQEFGGKPVILHQE